MGGVYSRVDRPAINPSLYDRTSSRYADDEGTALNPIRTAARSRIRRSRWSLQNMRARCAKVGWKNLSSNFCLQFGHRTEILIKLNSAIPTRDCGGYFGRNCRVQRMTHHFHRTLMPAVQFLRLRISARPSLPSSSHPSIVHPFFFAASRLRVKVLSNF